MNIFGREKIRSQLGGFCSTLLLGLVIWAAYNAGQDLFSTLNPKIVNYDYYVDHPRAVNLTRDSFPIAFGMQGPDSMDFSSFKNERIYTIRLTHNKFVRTRDKDGKTATLEKTNKTIKTDGCIKDYFGDRIAGVPAGGNIYCIDQNQPDLDSLQIQGVFTSPIYQELIAEVLICNNATSNNTCETPEVIEQYLSGAFFNAIYRDMVINPQNYTTPNNTFKEYFYTMISPANYKDTEIHLGYVEVSTDAGWIAEELGIQTFTKVNKLVESLKTEPHKDGVLIRVTFRMSQLETYYTRSYKKIQAVLAEVGSMANAGMIILVLVTASYTRLKFRESLMNELFDIKLPKNIYVSKKKKRANKTKTIAQLALEMKNEDQFQVQGQDSKEKEKAETGGEETERKTLDTSRLKSTLTTARAPLTEAIDIKGPIMPLEILSPTQMLLMTTEGEQRDLMKFGSLVKICSQPTNITSANTDTNLESNFTNRAKLYSDDNTHKPSISDVKTSEAQPGRKKKLTFANQKTNLVEKPATPRQKALEDENSLHLSFSSNDSKNEDGEQKELDDLKEFNLKSEQQSSKHLSVKIDIPERLEKSSHKSEKNKRIGELPTSLKPKTPQKLDVSMWEFIASLIMKPVASNKKVEMLNEGVNKVKERLDVINLLKKLREVDKLSMLLFDPDQLMLFNHIPKPELEPNDLNPYNRHLGHNRGDVKHDKDGASRDEVVSCYLKLKNKENKSELDKRLIRIYEDRKLFSADTLK